jgi:hypothetical protein
MAKIKMKNYVTAVVCSGLMIASCVSHELEGPMPIPQCHDVGTISFSNEVMGILETNCIKSGCHDNSQGPARNWSDPQAFKNKALEAQRRILLPADDPDHMPKDGVLSVEDIKTISCWVDQGAVITN